jgi:hypothetical protein
MTDIAIGIKTKLVIGSLGSQEQSQAQLLQDVTSNLGSRLFATPSRWSVEKGEHIKDRIKFVKIPEKYSPELLEKARASCKAKQ